jgi:hypothetical protein
MYEPWPCTSMTTPFTFSAGLRSATHTAATHPFYPAVDVHRQLLLTSATKVYKCWQCTTACCCQKHTVRCAGRGNCRHVQKQLLRAAAPPPQCSRIQRYPPKVAAGAATRPSKELDEACTARYVHEQLLTARANGQSRHHAIPPATATSSKAGSALSTKR